MIPDFWLHNWQIGNIGFNQSQVNASLKKYWSRLQLPAGSRVLVPLAGKSTDMIWLAQQGHRVLGVELSPLAVAQFMQENNLQPTIHESACGRHHVAGNIELICGDIFALDPARMVECTGIYDRAALIALPAPMRKRYTEKIYAHLPARARGLLLSMEYAQELLPGPPFSVPGDEIQALLAPRWTISELFRAHSPAISERFEQAGLSQITSAGYLLQAHDVDAA